MLRIVNASVSYIPLIRTLTMQIWPQTYVPIIGQEQVAYMLDRFYSEASLLDQMTHQQHQFIIAYEDEEPVAFASYGRIGPDTFKLHKLYILPAMQGKGVGRSLVEHIAAAVKKEGSEWLTLNVNIHNHAAMAFYERTGFTHFRSEDIDIGGGYFMNDHVLRRPVA